MADFRNISAQCLYCIDNFLAASTKLQTIALLQLLKRVTLSLHHALNHQNRPTTSKDIIYTSYAQNSTQTCMHVGLSDQSIMLVSNLVCSVDYPCCGIMAVLQLVLTSLCTHLFVNFLSINTLLSPKLSQVVEKWTQKVLPFAGATKDF